MNKLIAIAIISFAITGCASTATAPKTAMTAGDYCKGQARLVVSRMAVNNMSGSPLSGHSDPQEVRDYVYKDCLVKVTQR